MVSLQLINQSFHNHGDVLRRHIQLMDSRTQNSNGLISQLSLRRSTSITTSTTTNPKILETTVLLKKFTALPQTTRVFSHSHGEESPKLIQQMASRTQTSNGSQSKRRETSATTVSLKKSTDLHPTTRVSFLNHGEESLSHTQSMVSRTQASNGSIGQLLLNKRRLTLETRRSRRELLVSSTPTTPCTQPHTQGRSMPTTVI